MNKQQAHTIIRQTFENPFSKESYVGFIKNLLNSIEEAPFIYQGQFVPDAYKPYISVLERVGKYNDGENKIDILIIRLKKETSLERARTMQRNFVAWYLNGSRGGDLKDAALVAFTSPDETDWRFSLVKMDYRLERTPAGRTKVREEFTPARRWSFLVGPNEKSHTAQSRLVNILANDERLPVLVELEEAFNIETVTREFFLKYRDLFIRTKEELDKIVDSDMRVGNDFEEKGINTVDFAKKLLGQIVFLCFLQKKGWFGVGRDANWGTGSKQFMQELFEKKYGNYNNFFNDILEPLFYEALRIDRSHDDDYYSRFNCKIPFLNGGLFDPIGGYDWVHADIRLPDSLFSNKNKTREGDTGDGIMDIFSRYNFTVREDEPLEKEVAIDPELLGKAYEKFNAIRPDNFEEYKKALKSGKKGEESKFNKQYGVYYTPREIVHYMCRQSLICYLHSELSGGVAAYERVGEKQLDLFGNKAMEGQLDLTVTCMPGPAIEKEDIESFIYMGNLVSENEETAIIKEQRIIDGKQKTSDYRSVLPESIRKNAELIDKKLENITVCDPAVGSGAFPVGMMGEIAKARTILSTYIEEKNGRTSYDFKRRCIEHSLYGVDIDPGAVEIAKLRLWLSLIVDEEDIRTIKPLPNLDYKIVCGSSLESITWDVWDNNLFKELEMLKTRYFDETNPGQKKEEKSRIDVLIARLTNNDSIFNYHIHFSEVFDHRGGFDIVIANPPYVRQEEIKELKPKLSKEFGKFYCGTADLYTYFYKRGIDILKSGGHLCFIAPNKFMRAGYGKNTRKLLAEKVTPKTIIDFCDLPIFDATTYPAILLLEKHRPDKEETTLVATFTDISHLERIEEALVEVGFPMPVTVLSKDGWSLEQPEVLALMEKLRKAGTPLGEYVKGRFYYGIKTGLNDAFVIDEATRSRLIAEDPKSDELIKPWLRGRDIKKWKAEWAGLYLIAIPSGANKRWPWSDAKTEKQARSVFMNVYPAIHRYLAQWEEKLRKRDDQGQFWWELRSCAYYEEFEKPKIVYPDIAQAPEFAYDTSQAFPGNTAYIIPTNEIWLLGLLNSKVVWWFYSNLSSLIRGGFLRFIAQYMEQLPIPPTTPAQKSSIIALVNQILADPNSSDVFRLEVEINQIVYKLYDLTDAEIKIVESREKL